MKKLIIYLLIFAVTVVGAMSMLLLATYVPQERVDLHIQESVPGLMRESAYTTIWDKKGASMLDNHTDALILMESKAMVNDSKSTVLTNPLYIYGDDDPVTALNAYAYMVKPTPSGYYSRYWMGFRAVIRPLLAFLNYFQLRRYVGTALFVLLLILINSISKYLGRHHSMAFAFSILLVRPQVICSCLQYSCCFLIAFVAMLMVPWLHKNAKHQKLFFMELGMMTMYFDFYTTPVITFGLPMLYLCLLWAKEEKIQVLPVLKNAIVWLMGYIGMWLSKLVLTDLLTEDPALTQAWRSVSFRLGFAGGVTELKTRKLIIL